MRDALNTARTYRYMLTKILTGRSSRSADTLAAIATCVTAGGLTAITAATFGLFSNAVGDDSVAITSGLKVLTSANNPWVAGDVGKAIDIAKAGASSTTLRTRIVGFTSAGSVTVADAAGTTVAPSATSAGGLAVWGDDHTSTKTLPADGNAAGTQETADLAVSVVATGTTALRSLADRFADQVNIKDFGASPLGVIDATAFIQAAVAALPAGGGIVNIPAGTYKLTAAITTGGKNVWFRGQGKYATILRQDTVGASIHGIAHSGATQFLLVSDLSITTLADLTADNSQCAIRADIGSNVDAVDNSEIHVSNCYLSGWNFGCYVAGYNAAASQKFSIASMRNCYVRHCGATSASVSEAVNHHHVRLSVIEDNYFDALSLGDHSIYCYTPQHAVWKRNACVNTMGEAVKVITNPSAGEQVPYSWIVDENRFIGCLAACFMTVDGAYVLPLASFSRNAVITGGGGGSSNYEVLFGVLSTATIRNCIADGNTFQACQKGLIGYTAAAGGFIQNAVIDKLTAFDWSIASSGTYAAIADAGPGTLKSISVQGYFDGNSHGKQAYNLSVFGQIAYNPSRQINCTAPVYAGTSVELGLTGTNVNAQAIHSVDPNAGGGVSTGANTNETTLKTQTVLANSLAKTNQAIRIKAWGTTAANANAKTIKLKWGGTTMLTNGVTASPNGLIWQFDLTIFRTASSFISFIGRGIVGAVEQNPNSSVSSASDNTADRDITVTGQNGVATAGDITFQGMTVEYIS